MCEIFLFHALVLLVSHLQHSISETSESRTDSGEMIVLQNELTQLIKSENTLPLEFCKEILFAYDMQDQALTLYFHKQ